MFFIALLLRPWTLQMESVGAMARTLADDILLLTKGGRALNLFHEAFNFTMVHLHDLGGKVAPAKSLVFSTCVRHRHWLRRHVWIPLGQTITVVAHFRDPGAQLTTTNRTPTAQSKVRLQDGVKALHRIHRLPHEACCKTPFRGHMRQQESLIQLRGNACRRVPPAEIYVMRVTFSWN